MADPPKQEPPKEEPKVDSPKKDESKNNLLDVLEKDFIDQIKDKVDLEEYKEFSQEQRIKIFRSLSKTLSKPKEEPREKKEEKKMPPKGQAENPAEIPAAEKNHIPTLLERNNITEFRRDIQKKTSVMNMTDAIRGKQ